MAVPELRVVLLGSGSAGKSCLTIRLVTGHFLQDYDPTIEDHYSKIFEVDGESILLDIMDTAGQEEFSSLKYEYYRKGQAFLIVYSIESRSSFQEAKQFREKIIQERQDATNTIDPEPFVIVLAGTKCDLVNERVVQHHEGQSLADEWKCPFFECSAKNEINNIGIFGALVDEYRERIYHTNHGDQDGGNQIISKICNCCKKCWMVGCILFVYVCLCGCLFHGMFLCSRRICQCCKKQKLCGCNLKGDDNHKYHTANRSRSVYRNQGRLIFPKVKYIEEDFVDSPVLALKDFTIIRRFSWIRFTKAILCGLFLPIVIVFQTMIFLIFSEFRYPFFYQYIYPENYRYDEIHHSLLLDFLGLVVGRYPDEDPDAVKERNWFLRQSRTQKLQRVLITILVCAIPVICGYNVYTVYDAEDSLLGVSRMETIGPFLLFAIIWLLLSCWIAYESMLYPPMPSTTRLRSIKLYLGEKFNHMTDAHKFLRAYAWTRNRKWKLRTLRTMFIIFVGLLYACIPGLTRLTIGDPSDGLEEKKFITKREWKVQAGALFVNFVLVSSFMYAIEVQYAKHFDNYREWMGDLTLLLSKGTNNDENDEHYIPKKGRNFSEDIFLSLTRKSNALGWLEIRSFLAAEGKLLFAEQELPTLWILLLTIALAIFLLFRIFFISGDPFRSVLFNGASMLCIICLVSLIRIAITGYQFEAIQKMQERLLGEQRFFMRCSSKFNKKQENEIMSPTIRTLNNGSLSPKRMQRLNTTLLDVLDGQKSTMYKPFDTKTNDERMSAMKPKRRRLHTASFDDGDNLEMANIRNGDGGHEEEEEVKLQPLADNDEDMEDRDGDDDDMYENDEEMELRPLIEKTEKELIIDVGKDVKDIVEVSNGMVDKSDKSDKFAFIDNMLFIVERKDIFPRLFNVKLNSVLAKAIAGIFVGVLTACVKLLF